MRGAVPPPVLELVLALLNSILGPLGHHRHVVPVQLAQAGLPRGQLRAGAAVARRVGRPRHIRGRPRLETVVAHVAETTKQ